jgi:hypothetical protein
VGAGADGEEEAAVEARVLGSEGASVVLGPAKEVRGRVSARARARARVGGIIGGAHLRIWRR